MKGILVKYQLGVILLFLLLPVTILANIFNYSNLPDSSRLQIRLKSFLLIHPEEKLPDSLFTSELKIPLAFTFNGAHQAELIEKITACSSYQSQIPIISKNNLQVPEHIGSQIIICSPDLLDSLVCSCDTTKQIDNSGLSKNELLKVTLDGTDCKNACFDRWRKTGKLPNFIRVKPSEIDEAAKVVSFFNSTEKIYGVTLENDQLLSEVYWENNTDAKTYGYFSFPLKKYGGYHLVPYKAGYRFSPGIIVQSTSNMNDIKVFRGIKHEPDFGLDSYFTFRGKVKNHKWDNNKGIINNRVTFRKDKRFGGVACFENRSFIDAGPQSTEILKSGFSIIVWVKLNTSTGKNSILGKGQHFNLAIYHGELTFSMAGTNDYISEKSQVPKDSWTQVAMVYSKFNNQIDFYLNGKQTDQINLVNEYKGSDYTLLIGNNLWEEFFDGEMSEIKIWNRELDKDEIYYQYLHPVYKKNYTLIFVLLIIISAGVFLIFKYKQQRKRRNQPITTKPVKILGTENSQKGERILCFGGLKVFDATDTDISLKFSPRLKQIFILILLHSEDSNKGITSKQLAEILWPGAGMAKTKNIRSTYVQNLRLALSSFKNIELVFSNKKWFFDFAEDFYNEYFEFDSTLFQLDKEYDLKTLEARLPSVIAILKKGRFLEGMDESWLDPFIEKINNRIIEFCLTMFSVLDNNRHCALILDLAEIISLADPLNEPALRKKINLLIMQGKLSLAKNIYDNFVKLYKELYNENYAVDFKKIQIENS